MKIKKLSINEYLFYIGFIVFLICNFLRNTEININTDILWFFSISMLVVTCCRNKYTKKELIALLSLATFFAIVAFFSKNMFIMGVPVALIAAKGIDLKKIIKVILVVNIVLTVVTIFSSIYLGVGEVSQTRVFRSDMKVITRYYFGFVHPNQLAITVFSIVISSLVIFWEKINIKFVVIAILIAYVTNYYTDSNTSYYITVFMIFMAIVLRVFERKKIGTSYKVFSIGIILIVLFSIFCMVNYGKYAFIDYINKALSSRIHGSYAYYKANGFSMFGKNIFESSVVTFDQGINNVLLRYGVVLFVFMIYCIMKSFYKINNLNRYNYKFQFVIFICLFYSFFENIVYDMGRNIAIYIIFFILSKDRFEKINNRSKKIEEEEKI